MPVSKDPLIENINTALGRSTLTDQQAAQLAAAAGALSSSTACSVANCAALPTASANKGRFVYVQDIKQYRYSNGTSWSSTVSSCVTNPSNLWSWGSSTNGALGIGSGSTRSSPGTVAGNFKTWCFVNSDGTAGSVVAIKTDGTLWAWGLNTYGMLGDGTITTRTSPVTTAGGGTNWCKASISNYIAAGVKTDGTLWTWGYSNCGALGNGLAGFGSCRSSPGTTAGGGTNWCDVSIHYRNAAGIKTDGTLWTWGYNRCGALGDGTTTNRSSPGTTAGGGTNWCCVAVGGSMMAALKTDGTLWTWGYNYCGALGNGESMFTHRSSPFTTAGGGTNWCSLSIGCNGYNFVAAIKTDGTLWTWGDNQYYNLGDGTVTARCSPGTTAGGGTTWCQVSAGYTSILALKTDGTAWGWGLNNCGQLGDGTVTSKISPTSAALGLTSWQRVAIGGNWTSYGIRLNDSTGF